MRLSDSERIIQQANQAGVNPVLIKENQVFGSGRAMVLTLNQGSKHGLHISELRDAGVDFDDPAFVMCELQSEFLSWSAGTHDSIRDGAGSVKVSGPKRFYFLLAELKAKGVEV